MTIARLIVAIVAVPMLLLYAGGLIAIAILGLWFHRVRLDEIAAQARVSPIGVLLTTALLWPIMLVRVLRESRRG